MAVRRATSHCRPQCLTRGSMYRSLHNSSSVQRLASWFGRPNSQCPEKRGGYLSGMASRRCFIAPTQVALHGSFERQPPSSPDEVVGFTVVDREGKIHSMKGKVGDNLLYLFHHFQESDEKLYLEGACEASLACSTCHVILDDDSYDKLDLPEEEEDDMLDQATCLTATSRLGCQIILSKELDGMTVTLPKFSKNFYVDGHIPQPH
mmetsp:Transcript_42573/g.69212  ORF Transcript_42573/g.69212 Transcript_42573/m.69212 type:complete len:206 (+) Transcript_42573:8-625(+)